MGHEDRRPDVQNSGTSSSSKPQAALSTIADHEESHEYDESSMMEGH
jgi:hypothetical protein